MNINITLLGDPKSTQHCYKITCRGRFASMYMSKEAKDLKENYQWQIKSQYKGKILTGRLSIALKLVFGTRRRVDWDNFHKLSMDACTGIIWADDSQIDEAVVTKEYEKGKGRIEIMVIEME